MNRRPSDNHAAIVRAMFANIAQKYDLMNRIMTGFQDVRWRRFVIHRAELSPGSRLLDLGTGTGDLAREARRHQSAPLVVASDFTLEMMRVGMTKDTPLNWLAADALQIPFGESTFHAATSGFLMRNVSNIDRALSEQYRILVNGGRIILLDTTRPGRNMFSPFIWIHLHIIIPFLGRLITGSRDAYKYLPETTENFITAERMSELLDNAGFKNVRFRRFMFGTIAIHWAEK